MHWNEEFIQHLRACVKIKMLEILASVRVSWRIRANACVSSLMRETWQLCHPRCASLPAEKLFVAFRLLPFQLLTSLLLSTKLTSLLLSTKLPSFNEGKLMHVGYVRAQPEGSYSDPRLFFILFLDP